MSGRKNFYTGQVVQQDEMDGAFEYAEDAEHDLAVDNGNAQHTTAGTTVKYGGIVKGLVVTKKDADEIYISAGVAKDSLGRRIEVPSQAIIRLDNIGDTTIGSVGSAGSPLTGDGAAIAVTAGKEAWVSIYVVYEEVQSDARTDDLGVGVYFDEAESFYFYIAIGSEAVAPATNRSPLDVNKVLLADILLDDSEEIQVLGGADAICSSSYDLVVAGYGPDDAAALTGRRNDWLAAEDDSDFPQLSTAEGDGTYSALHAAVRGGNAREALYELVRMLNIQAPSGKDPAGAEMIGVRAKAGAISYTHGPGANSLAAGDLQGVLEDILATQNARVYRGGDYILPPGTTDYGLYFNPTNPFIKNAMLALAAERDGSVTPHMLFGGNYGHFVLPHVFYDDFFYKGTDDGFRDVWKLGLHEGTNPWGMYTGSAGTVRAQSVPGGVVEFHTSGGGADSIVLYLNGTENQTGLAYYRVADAPFTIFQMRFRIVTSKTNVGFGVYLTAVSGSGDFVAVERNNTSHGDSDIHLVASDASGTPVDSVLLADASLSVDAWYTVRFVSFSTTKIGGVIKGSGAAGSSLVTATLGGGDALTTDSYNVRIEVFDDGGAAAAGVQVDSFMIADASLASDMDWSA